MQRIFSLFIPFILWVGSTQTYAQCWVEFTPQQQMWLREFQQQMNQKDWPAANNLQMQYVPVQFHLTALDNGVGYFSLNNVLQSLCEINQRFEPAGFHFYLADTINYINNTRLFNGQADAIWTESFKYKNEQAVNVFYHGINTEGWCGVYFGGVDVVFVLHRCQLPGGTTLTHELGHFFSLPHTFRGWEGGNIPAQIERVDGSNCTTAGDGFCDTRPDYVSNRWGCNLGFELTDPNGIKFKPDSSLYMNYAADACHTRFSNQQMLAMQSNLNMRGIAKTIISGLQHLNPPGKLWPNDSNTVFNANHVNLAWQKVDGAFAYHIQIARFGNWDFINYDRLIYGDTAINIQLEANWPYQWRVKAITQANVCNAFSAPAHFTTIAPAVGVAEINLQPTISVIPNPAQTGNTVCIKSSAPVQVIIYTITGKHMQQIRVEPTQTTTLQLDKGVYVLVAIDEQTQGRQTLKLVVQD
jgi:hypothetical protein